VEELSVTDRARRFRDLVAFVSTLTIAFSVAGSVVDAADAKRAANSPRLAFVLSARDASQLGAEGRAALALARELAATTPIAVKADGALVDAEGRAASLEGFDVVWYHQGDSIDLAGPVHGAKTRAQLRKWVESGKGLYLSGAAFAMVGPLGVETAGIRRGGPGNDRGAATLRPVVKKHPVFAGLGGRGDVVTISDAGFPAFGDFHPHGPARGMLLARSGGGVEDPLVEYALGKGRVIAMGWRLPHYAHAGNRHRAELERLTSNIVTYLATPKSWCRVAHKPRARGSGGRGGGGAPKPPPDVADSEWRALDLAIRDLATTFADRYPRAGEFLGRLAALEVEHDRLLAASDDPATHAGAVASAKAALEKLAAQFAALRRDALLANPLLDFERLLAVKRRDGSSRLGLPANWEGNCSLPRSGYHDALVSLSLTRPDGELATIYEPADGRFIGDVDLHFDADRLLFSSTDDDRRWQVFEIDIDGSNRRRVTPRDDHVDNYDACYLPDGRIIYSSTAPFVGVPCVGGSAHVANLFLLDRATGDARRLTFEQDHDWCPTVLENGRVLYLRWEYSDIPHFVSRILFHMNPDGTEQVEYYGSNSYWPNSMFYARPVPGHSSKFVAIVTGHHGVGRMGELVLFDTAKGRREATGAMQRIPGYGKTVEPILRDRLVDASWPKYLHPWPLNDKYFLVAAKPTPRSRWGLYLVDVFDNRVLLREEPGFALLEPVPLRKRTAPSIVPDRVDPSRKDATVYIADIYVGDGLRGVPRGTVEKLRLFTYHFAYHGMGGQVNRVGLDGPWDVKRIIGTVPVERDGSALFRVPANTPISMQPLDSEGKALQLMRSWMTAMPGERVACVGCHESQDTTPPSHATLAIEGPPAEITPWYGPTRGFSFKREVQPVLDRYCVGCHDGKTEADGTRLIDLRRAPSVHPRANSASYNNGTKFSPSYMALRSWVRTATIESDMHMLSPGEFHADTTKLVQLLRKDHHGVRLDAEAWDRLITWIDLHAPAHGTWREIVGGAKVDRQRDLRRAMLARYAGLDEDPEAIPASAPVPSPAIPRPRVEAPPRAVECASWPFDAAEAKRRQKGAAAAPPNRTIDLGAGVELELVYVPAGEFVMGDADGCSDERPRHRVRIAEPFWMGRFEVTNEQFRRFDPRHDSRLEHGDFLQFSVRERGYGMNAPRQPVVRVSWHRAREFCRWLSDATGGEFDLPTEAQWEYACRAGTDTALSYGGVDDDFSKHANLADARQRKVDLFDWGLPVGAVPPWRPADERFNDGHRVTAPVGSFAPNAWGLCDLHGNAAEWTRSAWAPHPRADGGAVAPQARRVVRGGSWSSRPCTSRSASRLAYRPFLGVFDVGFRVVCRAPTTED